MSSDYEALLNATIQELEARKKSGIGYVRVEESTLLALTKPVVRQNPAVAANPAPTPVTSPAVPAAAISPANAPKAARPVELSTAPVTDKEAAMQALRARVLQCENCSNLAGSRKNVVFGVGNIHTELMFVGEAPGADEDEAGEPFVGKAGQLLTRIIQAMGYTRDSVYIANILKCRPDTPGQLTGNRKPTTDEMNTCLPYLLEQIRIVQPKAIVALGGTALEGLFGKTAGIMKLRGNWQAFQGIPVMPTYHPAYLLRNQLVSEKRKVWEDMLQVLEKLQRPISTKQRNYFTKDT